MNDNQKPDAPCILEFRRQNDAQSVQLAIVRDMASRAVIKPESLTMGEIQEVGWAFLMAAKELARATR